MHLHVTSSRLLTVLLTVALLGLPTALAAPAAGADEPDPEPTGLPTRVTVDTNFDPLYNETIVIKGQVQLVSYNETTKEYTYTPYPKQTVQLERCYTSCDQSTATWTEVAETKSDDNDQARYRFTLTAKRNATYRVMYPGPGIFIHGSGIIFPIRTHRHIPVKLTQPSAGRFVFSGRAWPGFGRKRVFLLRMTCAGGQCSDWKPYKSKITSRRGSFRFPVATPKRGAHRFAVRAPASANLAVSYSKYAQISVKR